MKNIHFDINALEDFEWWIKQDKLVAIKIIKMIQEISKTPFEGTGKPEPLKHNLKGCWSRRINLEHRLVYEVFEDKIRILSCRFHY